MHVQQCHSSIESNTVRAAMQEQQYELTQCEGNIIMAALGEQTIKKTTNKYSTLLHGIRAVPAGMQRTVHANTERLYLCNCCSG